MMFLTSLLLWSAVVVTASPVVSIIDSAITFPQIEYGASFEKRAAIPQDCIMSIKTEVWTGCASFIAKYHVPLDKFFLMNPSVGASCQTFKPGEEYCIRKVGKTPVSTDGKCGFQLGKTVTCVGSSFGSCCGKNGLCGSTADFCGIGNCQSGSCTSPGHTFDGSCGSDFGGLKCGGSWGTCCSKAGQCGSTSAFCGAGNCQSGACQGTVSSTTSTTARPVPTPRTPSPDGTCGFTDRYICNGTNPKIYYGNCCSAYGFCGSSLSHCSDLMGCQREFGLCDTTVIATKPIITSSSTTTRVIPSATPFLAGTIAGCDTWDMIKQGETCESIAAERGVSIEDFYRFNPSLAPNCVSGFWLGWYVCVSIIGHELGPPRNLTLPASPPPVAVAVSGGYRLWGCVTGNPSASLLLPGRYADTYMTLEKCIITATVNNARWVGLEFGWICRYGNQLNVTAAAVYPPTRPLANCNMKCQGDPGVLCGGANLLTLYERM